MKNSIHLIALFFLIATSCTAQQPARLVVSGKQLVLKVYQTFREHSKELPDFSQALTT
ncbi:MAG: hypothetical protein ABIP10_18760 [Ferruginibacter sp.]